MVKFKLNLCFIAIFSIVTTGCNTTNNLVSDRIKSIKELNEPILILAPISSNPNHKDICRNLGENLHYELSKIANNKVIFSNNIASLKPLVEWKNLVTNGELNIGELAAIGQAINSSSVLACQILEVSTYPPQRIILQFLWVESDTQRQICLVTNDINLRNKKIDKRYGEFSFGEKGTIRNKIKAKELETVKQAASLSTKDFRRFAANYSLESLINEINRYN